jgi:hypothetical protein
MPKFAFWRETRLRETEECDRQLTMTFDLQRKWNLMTDILGPVFSWRTHPHELEFALRCSCASRRHSTEERTFALRSAKFELDVEF